jgi:hypothetical protein
MMNWGLAQVERLVVVFAALSDLRITYPHAGVAELADALDSKSGFLTEVVVRTHSPVFPSKRPPHVGVPQESENGRGQHTTPEYDCGVVTSKQLVSERSGWD